MVSTARKKNIATRVIVNTAHRLAMVTQDELLCRRLLVVGINAQITCDLAEGENILLG